MASIASSMRVVFMGTPEFAVPSLKAIVESGATVVGVVTQPARPYGRGKAGGRGKAASRKIKDSPIKEFALGAGLKVFEPESAKGPELSGALASLKPDVIAVVAYGKILPREVLSLPPLGCINLHASLLPAYRGAAPINWAIINGETRTGVTTMLMDEGMDTGPVLLGREVDIEDFDTAETLSRKLSKTGAELLVETIAGVGSGGIEPKPQEDAKATHAPILKKNDGLIDWNMSAAEIERRIRGLTPWPGAYTTLDRKRLKLHSARVISEEGPEGAVAGTIYEAAGEGVKVKCARDTLLITGLQMEGKKRVSAVEFAKGYEVEGKRLGE